MQGAIQGPGEFAEGLFLGVRSLVGHTVGGAAGAVSRITGAMGHGLAALSLDKVNDLTQFSCPGTTDFTKTLYRTFTFAASLVVSRLIFEEAEIMAGDKYLKCLYITH